MDLLLQDLVLPPLLTIQNNFFLSVHQIKACNQYIHHLGDGCIDYKPLFDVLKEKNYSGWLVVEAEQDPAKANPFEYAKIGYKYLTETLNLSGIEIYKS